MKKDIKIVTILVISCIVVVPLLIITILLFKQEDLFFPKNKDEVSYNELLGKEEFEEVEIDNGDNKLYGWIRYNSKEEKSPLIIYFGGNYQSSSRVFNVNFRGIYQCFEGYNMIMVDYPKYGHSEGKITDEELFKEALLVYDYAIKLDLVDTSKIVVMGYSIGTGMATYLASQREVNGLILVAPYDELLSIYNASVPIFFGPLKTLAKFKLESKKYAENVEVSPLIITSYSDEVISHNFTERLAEHFKSIDELVIEKDLTHKQYFDDEDVLERIYEYLNK